MLEMIMNPGAMTQAQWLIVGMLVLLALGILFFVYRTYQVIKEATQNKYKPNIGLSRAQDAARDATDNQE